MRGDHGERGDLLAFDLLGHGGCLLGHEGDQVIAEAEHPALGLGGSCLALSRPRTWSPRWIIWAMAFWAVALGGLLAAAGEVRVTLGLFGVAPGFGGVLAGEGLMPSGVRGREDGGLLVGPGPSIEHRRGGRPADDDKTMAPPMAARRGLRRHHRQKRSAAVRRPRHDRLTGLESAEVLGQVAWGCVPQRGVLLEAFQADRLQVARKLGWNCDGVMGSWVLT